MKITEIAIKRPAFMTMVFCALAVIGIYSYLQMGVDFLPKMSWPMVFINTPYPGAGPKEVETQVSKPIEEALSSLTGLKSLRTYSNENISFAWIEFTMSTNTDNALNDVERKINEIRLRFPRDVRQPEISKVDINATPIMRIAVQSSLHDQEFYQFIKDRIQPKLEQVDGVAMVTIVGGKEREIRIEVDNEKLRAYTLSILQVSQKLGAENIDFPAGKIEQTGKRYIVRITGKFDNLDAIKNCIISSSDAGTVYLKDVANVLNHYEEKTYGRLNQTGCVGLIIQKASDANSIKCCDRIKSVMAKLEQEYRGRNLRFTIAQDITQFTRESLAGVRRDLGLAIIMVALVLFLFLHNVRNSLIVLLSIPTSLVTALIAMYAAGFTLNMVTLMALTMVIGILVDDSIVVLENIHRHLENGEEPFAAALRGRNEIGLAAIAITLVDVVVFLPIGMLSGVVGKIFGEFGLTVVAATLVSLFVSFTLTPMLASRWSRIIEYREGSFSNKASESIERFMHGLSAGYRSILLWALHHRAIVILISFSLLASALALAPLGYIGSEFLPGADRGEFAITIEMPVGTSLEKTNKTTSLMEKIVQETPDVSQYYALIGRSEGAHSGDLAPSISQIQIKLKKGKGSRKTEAVIAGLLNKMKTIPGAQVKASLIGIFGAADESPIAIEVRGENMDSLIAASEKALAIVKNTPGTRDAKSTWEEGQPEIRVVIDREKCARFKLSLGEVAMIVRNALEGEVCSKYREQDAEYDIRVILAEKNRQNPQDVGRITITNAEGAQVKLEEIAQVFYGKSPSEIARKDRSRVITLISNLDGSRSLGEVMKDVDKKVNAADLPRDITVFYGGDVENMQDMMHDMTLAILLAVLFIFMIMVSLFESYLYPFIIMFAIPVALVGGLTGLAITGKSLNALSMIGMLLSMGLVTKNAILLVDYTNTLRNGGLTLAGALLKAGPIRLRPILMTTATMVCGMLPLAIGMGKGGGMRQGMGIVVIGSLLSSTLLTLVLVPVMYSVLEGVKVRIVRLLHGNGAKG